MKRRKFKKKHIKMKIFQQIINRLTVYWQRFQTIKQLQFIRTVIFNVLIVASCCVCVLFFFSLRFVCTQRSQKPIFSLYHLYISFCHRIFHSLIGITSQLIYFNKTKCKHTFRNALSEIINLRPPIPTI